MEDNQIIKYEIGGIRIGDIGTMTFLGWVANKLNNVSVDQRGQERLIMIELTTLIANPPVGKLPDSEKISIIKKLIKLGIQL